jgi:hypothetical protein
MKHIITLLTLLICSLSSLFASSKLTQYKPRLVVMTDIGDADVEPDDNESAVRLLAYADCFEIEAICTTIGWNCDPYPEDWAEYLYRVIDSYAADLQNLMKRSRQKKFLPLKKENEKQKLGYWPSVEYIRSRSMMGSKRAGIGVVGEGNDSPGSEMLIRLALEDDPRPIWVASWGSSNTLAQAIWRYKQTATPAELKAFVRKFRVYTITDQDMQYSMRMNRAYSSHQWLRKEFKEDLLFIWDESAWLNQCELGKNNWQEYERHVMGKGALGKNYPKYKWGVEGDTPSFLHLMPNGLNDPEHPEQAGWGGYHTYHLSPDSITYAWTNWQQPVKDKSDAYEHRFYQDEFNDFAARMQWADEGKGNTNPVIIINGQKDIGPLHIKAKAGGSICLDAAATYDREKDKLTFLWWQQLEAGTYADAIPCTMGESMGGGEFGSMAILEIPNNASGKTVHFICEVKDNGPFQLVSYKRIIIEVE